MIGRPKAELVLTKAEQKQLTAQALALRARIVLSCAQGADNKTVAARHSRPSQWVRSCPQRLPPTGPWPPL